MLFSSVSLYSGCQTVMAVIALGYRAEEPRTPRHRELDEIVKFF